MKKYYQHNLIKALRAEANAEAYSERIREHKYAIANLREKRAEAIEKHTSHDAKIKELVSGNKPWKEVSKYINTSVDSDTDRALEKVQEMKALFLEYKLL